MAAMVASPIPGIDCKRSLFVVRFGSSFYVRSRNMFLKALNLLIQISDMVPHRVSNALMGNIDAVHLLGFHSD